MYGLSKHLLYEAYSGNKIEDFYGLFLMTLCSDIYMLGVRVGVKIRKMHPRCGNIRGVTTMRTCPFSHSKSRFI